MPCPETIRLTYCEHGKNVFPRSDRERETLPPFCGGIAGLLSYELGQAFERIPRPAVDDFKTPALLAGLFDWAIVWDHIAGTVRRYVLQLQDAQSPQRTMTLHDRVAWIDERLQRKSDHAPESVSTVVSNLQPGTIAEQYHRIEPTSGIYSDFTRDQYTTAVAESSSTSAPGISFRPICPSG